MTLVELIDREASRLKAAGVSFGHGTLNAFDESAWLVMWSLGMPIGALEDHAKKTLDDEQIAKAAALVEERITTRKPAAYLTHEAWLQDVPFFVDERSIVPRSFIAELIVDADESGELDGWLSDQTTRVLDLCTGNASLAVIAAMAYPDITVDAADTSSDALAVGRINVDRHQLGPRITLIESDLFAQLTGQRYDLILCNPPYVNAASMAALPPEYLAEPALALAGGTDGMDLVKRILASAPDHMTTIGVLVLEISNERGHFDAAFPRLEAAWLETSAGDDHVVVMTREALISARTPG